MPRPPRAAAPPQMAGRGRSPRAPAARSVARGRRRRPHAVDAVGAAVSVRGRRLGVGRLDEDGEGADGGVGVRRRLRRRVPAVRVRRARLYEGRVPRGGVAPILEAAVDGVHEVVHRGDGVVAVAGAAAAGAGEAAHLRRDRALRRVVGAAVRLRPVVIERAPVVGDRLHAAMEGDDELQQARAVELVQGARADGRHAGVGRLVVREIAVRVDAELAVPPPLHTDRIRHWHDQDRARVGQAANPWVGVVALDEPLAEGHGGHRTDALVAA